MNGEPLYSCMRLWTLTQCCLQAANRPDVHNLHDMSGSLQYPLCPGFAQMCMHTEPLSVCVHVLQAVRLIVVGGENSNETVYMVAWQMFIAV